MNGGCRKVHNEDFIISTFTKYYTYYDDKIKEDEMGRKCSTHGGGDKCVQYKSLLESLKGRDNAENLSVDGDNIKLDVKEIKLGV